MNRLSFDFAPPGWLPCQDAALIRNVRQIPLREMEQHTWENPAFRLKIVPDAQSQFVVDLTQRLRQSDLENSRLTVLLPGNHTAAYENIAEFCNKYAINCSNLHVFFLSEWADESGHVAPLEYEASYGRLFRKYFYARLQADLRPPEKQIHYLTSENVEAYSDMIDDIGQGGADVCYSSIGWSGRLAAIEPDGEFVCDSLEQYCRQTSRIVTNHMISIAEDSLLGIFGRSGDLASVPPKSATIGPRDIAHARGHFELQDKTSIDGRTAWQCMSARLMLFGPVSMSLPASILRLYRGTCYMSEAVAKDIITMPPVPDEVTFAD